jgi:hypothetical protein
MADLPECGKDRVEHPVAPARGTTSQRGSAASSHLFVCAGLLCLAVSYHLGAVSAKAQTSGQFRLVQYGDHAISVVSGDALYTLTDRWTSAGGPSGPLPVPDAEIAAYTGASLVTLDGIGWSYSNQVWVCVGPVPGGPTPAQSISIGQL